MTIDELRDANILITGAGGFLGCHLHSLLIRLGCKHVHGVTGRSGRTRQGFDGRGLQGFDLTKDVDVQHLFTPIRYGAKKRHVVFHLAGENGGIQKNLREPSDIFVQNTKMALNLLEACSQTGVEKVVSVVASCAYPAEEFVDSPCDLWKGPRDIMVESDFLDGPPHDSVACHGYAKRNLQLASSFFRKQHGLRAVCVCPTTMYGEGDSFDPNRTKVMGGMVKRFVDAVDEEANFVSVWGSGKPMREFLYAPDCAKLLVEAMLKYDDSDLPLNLGTGQELSIAALAELVASVVKYKGEIHFDTTKPDGQFRKRLDLTWMKQILGQFEPTPLLEGVENTIDYYRSIKKRGHREQESVRAGGRV